MTISKSKQMTLNGAEQCLYNYEYKFYVEELKFSHEEATKKAEAKILNCRKILKSQKGIFRYV
jgi:hypothetical protein